MASAESADEHASHHPSGGQESQQQPNSDEPGGAMGAMAPSVILGVPRRVPNPSSMGGAMGGMMDDMMRKMGVPPPKALYPSMMTLSEITKEQRVELQQQSLERINQGQVLLSLAQEEFQKAVQNENYTAARIAAREARNAIARFDSGVAVQLALREGQVPQRIALDWFKGEMGLNNSDLALPTRGSFLGFTGFHYLAMAITLAFALVSLYVLLSRQRRALTLALRLAATPVSVPSPVRASASPVGGWSGTLRVVQIFKETNDVSTFRLAPMLGDDLPFPFEPGQFLTISVSINDKTVSRSYSISSSPACRGWCDITVKKTPGGVVSGYLHDHIKINDVLSAAGPYGRFTFIGREATSVVMIAGGVGITPIMGSIRFLTDQSWTGDIFLIYACVNRASIIFSDELSYLAKRHPHFHLTLVLSDEPSDDWVGSRGFVTAELIKNIVPSVVTQRVHLCGPPAMMDAVRHQLIILGLPEAQLFTEQFLGSDSSKKSVDTAPAIQCRLVRSKATFPMNSHQTILEAGEAAGISLDYSCRVGFCGVCKVRLLEGQVTMDVEDGLSAADKAAGYVLTCQAKSIQDLVVDV